MKFLFFLSFVELLELLKALLLNQLHTDNYGKFKKVISPFLLARYAHPFLLLHHHLVLGLLPTTQTAKAEKSRARSRRCVIFNFSLSLQWICRRWILFPTTAWTAARISQATTTGLAALEAIQTTPATRLLSIRRRLLLWNLFLNGNEKTFSYWLKRASIRSRAFVCNLRRRQPNKLIAIQIRNASRLHSHESRKRKMCM